LKERCCWCSDNGGGALQAAAAVATEEVEVGGCSWATIATKLGPKRISKKKTDKRTGNLLQNGLSNTEYAP
jgi:hypothetical protein